MGGEVGLNSQENPEEEAQGEGGGKGVPEGGDPAAVEKDEGAVEGFGVELELAVVVDNCVDQKWPGDEEEAGEEGEVAVAADSVDGHAEEERDAGDEVEGGVLDEEVKKPLGLA